ncbi:MAG: class I SAM-dependent methyltransferase [Leptospiraceae bacterium]|nr:class I SAM-dependent methyltransferase [Leptospiraceae bacterium]MCP5498362.1 class I SAM-dependent methyltransferase [Leptospiraceae bacterium]
MINKKFSLSIYREGFEKFIDTELIERPLPVMKEMEVYAETNYIPILSPSAGSVLSFLVGHYKPETILELGTGIGYSTAWILASGEKLQITSIDRNQKNTEVAKNFLSQIPGGESVRFVNEWIVDHIKARENLYEYKLVFIDCDKICYPELLYLLQEKLLPGSIMIFDNSLWHAKLMNPDPEKLSDMAMLEFWKLVKESSLKRCLFTNGDGLLALELK